MRCSKPAHQADREIEHRLMLQIAIIDVPVCSVMMAFLRDTFPMIIHSILAIQVIVIMVCDPAHTTD